MPKKYTRRVAPDINVSERTLKPQEAIMQGDLDEADRLIEERLKRGVFDYTSGKIEFSGDFVGRWFNEAVNGQQIYRARRRGWLPATLGMIQDPEQLGVYALDTSNHIVRGQRGEEHLMFMASERNEQVAQAKTAENMKRMGSTRKTKDQIASVASQTLGPEAAEFVERHVIGEIKDSVEVVERLEQN
jgi:hypothetical protein